MRNLSRNRRRNVATMLAVAFGYAGLVLLGGYILRVEHYLGTAAIYVNHVGHVAIWKHDGFEKAFVKPKKYSLTAEDQATINAVLAADPRVDFAGKYLLGAGLVGNGCKTIPFLATGLEPEIDRRIRNHPQVLDAVPELARPIRGSELAAYADLPAVGLSTGLMELLGKKHIHDELAPDQGVVLITDCQAADTPARLAADSNIQLAGATYSGQFSAVDGEIANVFSTGNTALEDSGLQAPLSLLQQLYDTDQVTYVAVFLKDPSEIAAFASELKATLAANGLDTDVFPYTNSAVSPYYVGTMNFLFVMAAFIGTVVGSVVVLSILNSMTMTILERSREIGTFRSIGFTRSAMLGLFVREGFLLTSAGVVVGAVLAYSTAAAVNAANIRFSPPGVPGTMQLLLTPNIALGFVVGAAMLVLAVLATVVATWGRVRLSVATLNTSLAS